MLRTGRLETRTHFLEHKNVDKPEEINKLLVRCGGNGSRTPQLPFATE